MATIRLNKQNKTIKVVNRKDNINLQHTGHIGPTGDPGPQGPQGPTGATGVSTFVRVHHSANPNVARPSALYVEWVGTQAPNNGTTEDTWIDTG
jgi:hypothetical protein